MSVLQSVLLHLPRGSADPNAQQGSHRLFDLFVLLPDVAEWVEDATKEVEDEEEGRL